ncbi:hypothetical protein [Janthinobacterium sp.]|uniref:phage tail tip fiber protein n=1 Tax=Janthinobacterium sp. TaxID=1871054 RepID=UPI00289DD183|nr:hypothetical protein [Janthinobacterium sp.]
MSALLGERDRLIMNTVPRYSTPIDRALMLSASATMFEVSLAGVPTPATITFSALMLGAVGEVTFASEPPVPLTVTNGDAVLKFADMTASIVTVTATTVIDGLTYYARQTIAKTQALDLRPPPAPTGLVATGTPAAIVLHWNAAPANYSNLSHTEVWRASVNDFAQAALVGRADGREYTDPVGPGVFRYYWIRYVSRASIPGPYNASSGTVGASNAEVEHLLQVLTGEITQSQLHADLGAKIDLIDELDEAYGDTASAASSAAAAAQAAAAAALDAAAADAAAGGASQYASQANQSATSASTAAGAASTSAGQSSQAASAAGGSAAAAENSARTAANSAGAAGASASAASTSKDSAAGSATAAGVQAAASSQSAIEAKAARDSASGAASAALQSAGTASAASTAAGQSAASASSSAGTATTKAADAGVFASQAATSKSGADGSAQAAANFLQQAQAILTDPVTGLVQKYAAVKVLADATANSLGQVQAKYSVQVDADGVAGGLELIAGGGRVDLGVRASTFFIAAPASSGIPTAVPFIVRTTETVIGGVTIPIGMYVADAFIQNASITNAKIGGDIWSSNFVAGQSGWRLYRSGDLEINNLRARGAIAGGGFTGWGWPGNGGGYYLGPEGLLMGNAGTGKYLQVTANGDVEAPGLSIVNGNAKFSGELIAATGTIGMLRSRTTGGRVEISGDAIKTFDDNGTLRGTFGKRTA